MKNATHTAVTAALSLARKAHYFDVDASAAFLTETHRASSREDLAVACRNGIGRLFNRPQGEHYEETQIDAAMNAVNDLYDAVIAADPFVVLGSSVAAPN